MQLAPDPTTPPVHSTSPYLPEAVTGSPWLLDPAAGRAALPGPWIPATRRLDRHAVAADLRLLPSLFDHSYAWADRLGGRAELDQLFERHARRVERRAEQHPTIEARDAFAPVMRELFARYPEQHMWTNVSRTFAHHRDPSLATWEYRGPVDALDAARSVAGAIPETAATIDRIGPRGGVSKVGSVAVRGVEGLADLERLGYQSIADAVDGATLVGAPDEPTYAWRRIGDTAVIRLSSFSGDDQAQEALRRFVADAPQHREASSIVLDLRGNGGGNDGYMLEWIQQLRSHRTTLASYGDGGFRDGRSAAVGIWNMATQYGIEQPGAPGVDDLASAARETPALWPLSERTPHTVEQWDDPRGTARSNYDGTVVVLVDRFNASSGESAALMARNWLDAMIIGERTGGAIEGGNVLSYPLPNTGVAITIPGIRSTYDDPAIRESAGIPIDVALADPGAPIERLLPHLAPWLVRDATPAR